MRRVWPGNTSDILERILATLSRIAGQSGSVGLTQPPSCPSSDEPLRLQSGDQPPRRGSFSVALVACSQSRLRLRSYTRDHFYGQRSILCACNFSPSQFGDVVLDCLQVDVARLFGVGAGDLI